ncbi:hypothetical protein GCM10010492_11470 [Saccharothrix mutabilis subsp. mutabilis]|uniref:Uncharacterized protein n=1 Tax=Saccharothrix mutabilis subsp. mutabilis TaxID=66855 RepID=A0ABP3CTY1_9PSEU
MIGTGPYSTLPPLISHDSFVDSRMHAPSVMSHGVPSTVTGGGGGAGCGVGVSETVDDATGDDGAAAGEDNVEDDGDATTDDWSDVDGAAVG